MYNRKKRKSNPASARAQDDEGPSAETKNVVGPTSQMKESDVSIVISDSDSLELEEDLSARQKRAAHRKTLAAKRKIARMTEEEQLALAVKMSQQEQESCLKHRQEDDDELLKKVIEESLLSCNTADNLPVASNPGLLVDLSSCEDDVVEKPIKEHVLPLQNSKVCPDYSHSPRMARSQELVESASMMPSAIGIAEQRKDSLCQRVSMSDQDPLQSPKVFLKRQDIVESTSAMSPAEDDVALDGQGSERLSQQSLMSDQDPLQSPKVLLKRLSQDIVESTSVILSPNCKDPFSCISSGRASTSLSQSSCSDFVRVSPGRLALSPVFPKRSSNASRLIPCRLFEGKSPSDRDQLGEMDDIYSHCSESPDLNSASLLSTSKPEVPEVGSSSQNKDLCSKEQNYTSPIENRHVVSQTESAATNCVKEQQNNGRIHYYWGIPFCPKGTDPNAYTQVILCQMEAYEKSLKKAQRQLLHKAEYRQPINLTSQSELTGQNDNQSSQDDTEELVDVHDRQRVCPSPLEPTEESDGSEMQPGSSKRPRIADDLLKQSQEDDHSEPLQEEPVKQPTPEPVTYNAPDECEGVARMELENSSIPPAALSDDHCPKEHMEIDQDDEITSCPETQLPLEMQDSDLKEKLDSPDITPDKTPPSSQVPYPNASSSEEIVSLEVNSPQDVECPMCGCTFPLDQIEQHAAYCDGTKDEPDMAVLRPRNRLSKQKKDVPKDGFSPSDSGKSEKCYLCKSLVPLKDYTTHVDSCLKMASLENAKSEGSGQLKRTKETAVKEGRLLSMLERTEAISADENTAIDFSSMSPPRENYADPNHLSISDSPIRSFLPISEATDCLVDFKRQFRSHPDRQANRRVPRSRGRGKRRRR